MSDETIELADAERTLRGLGVPGTVEAVIVAELDRLRDEVARMSRTAPAQQTQELEVAEFYVRSVAETDECFHENTSELTPLRCKAIASELDRLRTKNAQLRAEMEDMVNSGSKHDAFMARLQSAVEPLLSAPAQDRATRAEVRTLGDAWDDGVEAACEWFDVDARAPRLDALYKSNPYRTAERAGKDGT